MEIAFDLTRTVTGFLRRRQAEKGLTGPLENGSAVFVSGLLDSVALLELVAAVEASSGQALDMLRFDPSSVETLGELVEELTQALDA